MKAILFLLIAIVISWYLMLSHLTGCKVNGLNVENKMDTDDKGFDFGEDYSDKQERVEIKEVKEIKKEIVDNNIISFVYLIVKIKEVNLYATCYSQQDSTIEMKGIYANQKYASFLNKSERRINRNHYTVALNYNMKEYHEGLINVNGIWTHRYRFHVPDYNADIIEKFKIKNDTYMNDIDYLRIFNNDYFSVPRDRMSNKKEYANRIDVLFTTAGKYSTIKQRQRAWARRNTHNMPIEIWEIQKWAFCKDGSKRRIE